jgi:hypothetical protein
MRSRTAAARPAEPPPELKFEQPKRELEPEAAPEPARPTAPSPGPGYLAPGYSRIVKTVFDVPDPSEVFDRLRKELSLGMQASRADYGTTIDALDRAESNAQEAAELAINAKLAHELYLADQVALRGALREQALARLQAEKAEGKRSKAITNDDIDGAIASMFPDEYRAQSQRDAEARGMLAATESLAERWRERARDLRAHVQTVRG